MNEGVRAPRWRTRGWHSSVTRFVQVRNFHGIEIEDWPARIAATALHLVEHQANQEMEARLGQAPELLPLDKVQTIHVGNALRLDWAEKLEPSGDVTIVGNPPFLGHATRSKEQAQELRDVWQRKDIGRLDYVTGWYKKSLDYFAGVSGGRWGFVSTNSITQGEPVPALFEPVFDAGWRIRFAHRTFAWTSEAPGAANVHCTIVGFDREKRPAPRLFDYKDIRSEPEEQVAKQINGYLVDAPNVLLDQRRQVLAPDLGKATFGNMPRDGGSLVVTVEAYDEVSADPVAAKYLRRYLGAKELVRDEDRWCLWLVDLEPSDITKSTILRQRLEAVKGFRAASSAESTRQMAATPHLFGQRSQPDTDYVGIPKVVSERRPFFTVQLLPADVIASDQVFKIADPDGFQFAILSSSMFITWQKTVGGRMKSDIRFSNTLVWNNLPLPKVEDGLREQIVAAGYGVLQARERHPERSLADHYNPLVMDPALLKAHAKLDTLVDRAFGATKTCEDENQRQEILFTRYAEMAHDE